MPVSGINQEYQSFKGGLFTEGNELEAPQETTKDEANMTLTAKGNREVRLGFDIELGGTKNTTSLNSLGPVSKFIWKNPNNDPDKEFLVTTAARELNIYDNKASPVFSSLALYSNTSLTSAISPPSFTTHDGNLVMATGFNKPKVLNYDGTSFTLSDIEVEIRDLFGIDDSLTIEERPSSLTGHHKYNLYNQGWYKQVENAAAATVYCIDEWNTVKSDFPSNVDIWNIYKNTSEQFVPAQDLKIAIGNTPAPKGHFIITALGQRGASRRAKVNVGAPDQDLFSNTTAGPATLTGNPDDYEQGFFSCVESHAGRVFYAGLESDIDDPDDFSPNFTEFVFFSQVTSRTADYGKCYQAADPTDQFDPILVATDGGYIPVKGAGKIYEMVSFGDNLLLFAENGVWGLLGGPSGFTANTNYVYRITNIGILDVDSIVQTPTSLYCWLQTGIFEFFINPDSSTVSAKSISDQSVQSKFSNIVLGAGTSVSGAYDRFSKKIHWAYSTQNNTSIFQNTVFEYLKDKILTYDLRYNAFTEQTYNAVSTSVGPYIFALCPLSSRNVVGTAEVSSIGYLCLTDLEDTAGAISNARLFLAKETNADFIDWYSEDNIGITYSAYIVTQQLIPGDTQRRKRPMYLITHCKRTEQNFIDDGAGQPTLDDPSSCKIQARWDFADNSISGKWDNEFEAYRFLRAYVPASVSEPFNYGQEVITTKNKLRGSGRALTIRISNTPGKNLKLLGIGLTGLVQNAV